MKPSVLRNLNGPFEIQKKTLNSYLVVISNIPVPSNGKNKMEAKGNVTPFPLVSLPIHWTKGTFYFVLKKKFA